jgi:hypothetical protein
MARRKFTLRALAAQGSTHETFPVKRNPNHAGMRLTINVTAFNGTSITPTIHFVDPADGETAIAMLAGAAITGAGLHVLTIHPAATTLAAASGFAARGDAAPLLWQLVTTGTLTSATWSAVVEYFD